MFLDYLPFLGRPVKTYLQALLRTTSGLLYGFYHICFIMKITTFFCFGFPDLTYRRYMQLLQKRKQFSMNSTRSEQTSPKVTLWCMVILTLVTNRFQLLLAIGNLITDS